MKQLKAFLLAEADTIIAKDADDAVAVWEDNQRKETSQWSPVELLELIPE